MSKKIDSVADANGILYREIKRKTAELAQRQCAARNAEAVAAKASERDRRKFIPTRMN